jgi:ribonuclease T1
VFGLSRATLRTLGGVALVVVVGLVWALTQGGSGTTADPSSATATATAQASVDPVSGLPWIAASSLPSQAREVLDQIDAGGPYAYPGKDGSVFGNFEGVLPRQRRGYYSEYTVPTPGSSTRGARRIVTGSGGELYWTADHYAHFSRVRR